MLTLANSLNAILDEWISGSSSQVNGLEVLPKIKDILLRVYKRTVFENYFNKRKFALKS